MEQLMDPPGGLIVTGSVRVAPGAAIHMFA